MGFAKSLCLLSIFYFVCNVCFVNGSEYEYVPVYLWQTSKVYQTVPALSKISAETFGELVQERLGKDTIVVTFAEQTLSPEDFGTLTKSGENVFTLLSHRVKSEATTLYIPLVQDPILSVEKLFSGDIATIPAKDFDVNNLKTNAIIIDLNDALEDEDRSSMLARHDKIINSIYEELTGKYKNVIGVFTGYRASWVIPDNVLSRKVRETTKQQEKPAKAGGKAEGDESDAFSLNSERFLMYASHPGKLTIGNEQHIIDGTYTASTRPSEVQTELQVELTKTGSPSLTFSFAIEGTYWKLVGVQTQNDMFKVKPISQPFKFSYQCPNQTFTSLNASENTLSFSNFQIEVFTIGNGSQALPLSFDPAYFCMGFTSAPIWSGLFVTFILAAIMAIGLIMMMDMKTMDRFDDPKGKTIIINASE